MIFIDTGAFLGRYLLRDQFHAAAVRGWEGLDGQRLYTSNFVLDEVLTLLMRRAGPSFAVARAQRMWGSSSLVILRPEAEDERQALDWFARLSDQRVSFTDCVSFALMRRHRLRRAFTFDRHFAAAGFETWPS